MEVEELLDLRQHMTASVYSKFVESELGEEYLTDE
jgi:hypothetical protein